MPILIARCFQEDHAGEYAALQRIEKVLAVVLMIGGIGRSDLTGRPRMGRIRSARIELERLVMRDVVNLGRKRAGLRRSGACAAGRVIRVLKRKVKSTFEPSPAETRSVEQVADVLAAETGGVARIADIAGRLWVGGNRSEI